MTSVSSGLSGPDAVSLSVTSLLGPFASPGAVVRLSPARFPVVNAAAESISPLQVRLDPLRNSQRGTTVDAELRIRWVRPDLQAGGKAVPHLVLAPGESAELEIAGTVPAEAGAYVSAVRVRSEDGELLVAPVTVEVAASPIWGAFLMLVGLSLLGLLNLLGGESDVRAKLRDVLQFRQETHERLEQEPPPESRVADVVALDRHLGAALAALGEGRSWSIIDRRMVDADAHLRAAKDIADGIRKSLSGAAPGAAEVTELLKEWEALQKQMQDLNARMQAAAGPVMQSALAGRLEAFLQRFEDRILGLPMQIISLEMAAQIDRVRLSFAAGESNKARDGASAMRRWMRRAAATLDARLGMVIGYQVTAGSMIAAEASIRQRLAAGDLPEEARNAIAGMLDQAAAQLGSDAWLQDHAAAYEQIEDAETMLTRARSDAMLARMHAAAVVVEADTSLDAVNRVMAEVAAVPGQSKQAKASGLLRVMEAWRERVAIVSDETVRRALVDRIDAVAEALTRVDLEGTKPLYRTLIDDWTAYGLRRQQQAARDVAVPYCRDNREGLQRQLQGIEENVKLQGPRPELPRWEGSLDQIRMEALQVPLDDATTPDDCMAPLLDLGRRASALSGEVFSAMISNAPIPAEDRVGAAQRSGVAEALELARKLRVGPRPLSLGITTPEPEWYIDRTIIFSVANLDPVWGPGVQIAVDFGDGTTPFLTTAERLRQGQSIQHVYVSAVSAFPRIWAAEQLPPGTRETLGLLGEGMARISVLPSPVSAAQALADAFLNARFLVALMIASIVYFWRFHSGKKLFGSRGFDYVEPFALGFAVDAAVVHLPEALGKIPLPQLFG